MKIEEMNLSVRSYNCLKVAKINTLEQLINRTKKELNLIRNLGNGSKKEVVSEVEKLGYKFKEEI